MPNPFAIVQAALTDSGKRSKNWRDDLRSKVGHNLHDILYDLAQGKAWQATLADGRLSAPVLPSSDVRLRAAMYLHEALYGKAVIQTEVQKAELEAREMESINALSDDELAIEAMKIIHGRRVPALVESTEAVIIEENPKEMTDHDLAVRVFSATTEETPE
jgi:hypothetical protein